ncbi:MAG: FecR domain-containing protein [Planctomycetaceae bacterium]|jgi:hypothetical protein|nr:FecR domain-containing protein [Planctomycetaceae bacterium]
MKESELELLHRYLDGVITSEELANLEDLLRSNKEARSTLRSLATIDAKWQQLAVNEAVGDSSASGNTPQRWRAMPIWLALSAIAASLTIAALGWFRPMETPSIATTRGIARVIRIEGAGNVDQDRIVSDGAELFAGEEVSLQQGLIELAFRETGVHVIATAPLKLELKSNGKVFLHQGQVKLVVPPQGIGFIVDTAERKFIDLGTSFVVTASPKGSEVLVLDGKISVDQHDGESEELMLEGEFAKFDRNGRIEKRTPSRLSLALPELTLPKLNPKHQSLIGSVFGYDRATTIVKSKVSDDFIGQELLPLIRSQFQDKSCLNAFNQSDPIPFRGIAGAYHEFPNRNGLTTYSRDGGWMAWYRGQVSPPQSGRYRFWGYADNHLLVAIGGKPVFEGSRRESSFKKLGIPRTDNPALPCLIAPAGFACSEWIELTGDPVRIDIMLGEVGGNITSGLLLVEREGASYEETFWGQPKWPLFLTEIPSNDQVAELQSLVSHLEEKTMGSFSVSEEAIWKVKD